MKSPLLLLVSTFFIAFSGVSFAQLYETETGRVRVEKIAEGLDTPWAMAKLPDGNLVVTLRGGKMMIVDSNGSGTLEEVGNVPAVAAIGQGGLLDVIADRDFENNTTLYFTFSKPDDKGGAGTAIASTQLVTKPKPVLKNTKVLFSMKHTTSSAYHFGSRIVQADDGTLFFTIGDRGERENAQDPKHAAGSVLRVNPDGSIPSDNPYPQGGKWLPQIWSIGHRNPQGATLHDETGELWTIAHGARGGDEINIPKAGKNYGWPIISYGRHYSGLKIGVGTTAPGMEQPVHYWDPSIAPSGADFYTGEAIPGWEGNLFVGALKNQMLVRLEIEGNRVVSEEHLFAEEFGRVRDVRDFGDGSIWFLTDDSDGAIYRIVAAQ